MTLNMNVYLTHLRLQIYLNFTSSDLERWIWYYCSNFLIFIVKHSTIPTGNIPISYTYTYILSVNDKKLTMFKATYGKTKLTIYLFKVSMKNIKATLIDIIPLFLLMLWSNARHFRGRGRRGGRSVVFSGGREIKIFSSVFRVFGKNMVEKRYFQR